MGDYAPQCPFGSTTALAQECQSLRYPEGALLTSRALEGNQSINEIDNRKRKAKEKCDKFKSGLDQQMSEDRCQMSEMIFDI
jgi:hypothetical protein